MSASVLDESIAALELNGAASTMEQTIWGLTAVELHDRHWAARGVQVVRPGQRSQIVDRAELYLLTDPRTLTMFVPARLVDRLYWANAMLIVVRINDKRQRRYEERIVTDAHDNFIRFERHYGHRDTRLARVAFTPDRAVADAWQAAHNAREGARVLRRMVHRSDKLVDHVAADTFDQTDPAERSAFVNSLVKTWARPDITIDRCRQQTAGVWVDESAAVDLGAQFDGQVWVGAGRGIEARLPVLGPAVLWDDPLARPSVSDVRWQELEPTQIAYTQAVRIARGRSWLSRKTKRAFDILFALFALLITAPIYPIVALAIWYEDGWPFIFGQFRETRGGREFRCWKFRSMRKDAEQLKPHLVQQNQSDGPQFFIKEDPRLTRVGRFLRRFNIDELPQFFNVLRGDMSVVGPRPSPRRENQFCPPWREARLSVRAGITGLWQLMRTRRTGMDFQEWIRYDLEYVERMSLRLDLTIIYQTIKHALRGKL